MRLSSAFTAVIICMVTWTYASPVLESRSGISQSTYDDLVRYTKYSSGAYQLVCVSPLGNTFVESFSDLISNTQGYIARDDTRNEIVVAFRGSQQIADFFVDAEIIQVPLHSPGITNVGDAYVHTGFLSAYNAVASVVISTVTSQIAAYPGYTLISTGHSLGGALASLGGLSLKANFPKSIVKMYTFGQPRTGNPAYAALVDSTVGTSNIWRGVHTFDGVPTILPQSLGYQHHSTEFWQFIEPGKSTQLLLRTSSNALGMKTPHAATPSCINIAHVTYFGQVMSLDPTVCL